ncbi:MAG: hypothetical protein Q7R35_12510 [Elusimicrobiota bacterium]|nr:hypothetical protein [Elusimicrobiota bacterium]
MSENPQEIITVIKTGTPAEVKQAQKQFEKYWDGLRDDKDKAAKEAVVELLLREIHSMDSVLDVEHQAYLINTVRWGLWTNIDKHFDKWRDFVLKYIQHPSGKIRIAVIRACDYITLELGVPAQFYRDMKNKGPLSAQEAADFKERKNKFGLFTLAVEELLRKYDEPRFRRYKYVASMPPSVYKSLQQLVTEVLLRNEFYDGIYREFLRELNLGGRA